MAKISKATVDKDLRDRAFSWLIEENANCGENFTKINDRQYGVLLTDLNGNQRYIRIGAIVAELREDMTAEELMRSEIDAYQAKQDEKAIKAKAKAEKAEKDKAKRAAEKGE